MCRWYCFIAPSVSGLCEGISGRGAYSGAVWEPHCHSETSLTGGMNVPPPSLAFLNAVLFWSQFYISLPTILFNSKEYYPDIIVVDSFLLNWKLNQYWFSISFQKGIQSTIYEVQHLDSCHHNMNWKYSPHFTWI